MASLILTLSDDTLTVARWRGAPTGSVEYGVYTYISIILITECGFFVFVGVDNVSVLSL